MRYNAFHDNFLLSSGSDSRVLLSNMASLSSDAPAGGECGRPVQGDLSQAQDPPFHGRGFFSFVPYLSPGAGPVDSHAGDEGDLTETQQRARYGAMSVGLWRLPL